MAVDSVSPTVFCIAETGDLVKWFDCSDYMREPSDIAVNAKEYFVCDFKVKRKTSWNMTCIRSCGSGFNAHVTRNYQGCLVSEGKSWDKKNFLKARQF